MIDFLQFATVKSIIIFAICEICPADHLKAEKRQFPRHLQFCVFLFSSCISNLEFFLINRD